MTTEIRDVEAIDLSYVPRFRDDVVAVPVKDEAVLYEEETGLLHQLDPIATIVCSLFDDKTALAEVVDQLVAAFAVDRDVIEGDVLRLVHEFGRLGLFRDVQGEELEPGDVGGC